MRRLGFLHNLVIVVLLFQDQLLLPQAFVRRTTKPHASTIALLSATSISTRPMSHRFGSISYPDLKTLRQNFRLPAVKNEDDAMARQTSEVSPSEEHTDSIKLIVYVTVGLLYWYWMVFGALAASQGWPGVPTSLPLHPGWPPTDADLKPVLEDAPHFFYLADLLGTETAPYVQPVRLAVFNIAEAWVVAMLPALWADGKKRLNKWVLLALWSILGINLTNAFLMPYLGLTETNFNNESSAAGKNVLVARTMATACTAVVATALWQVGTVATITDWTEFWSLVQTDRTYLAFCVDICLFTLVQPWILARVEPAKRSIYSVPLIGLLAWLWQDDAVAPPPIE